MDSSESGKDILVRVYEYCIFQYAACEVTKWC